MPDARQNLKTCLRFMARYFAHEGPNGGPAFTRLPGDGARGADTPDWRREYLQTGRHCAPTTGPGWLVWRTAPWSELFKLVSTKQRGEHTSTCVNE